MSFQNPCRLASLVWFLLVLSACEQTGVQPETSLGSLPPSGSFKTAGGFLLGEPELRRAYNEFTRDLARALQDPTARWTVYTSLHASPWPEHKLHFRTFLTGQGRALLDAIAAVRHVMPEVTLVSLDSLPDLEFYMPVQKHWTRWDGGAGLLVVNDLSDDDAVPPTLFDLEGTPMAASEFEPPVIPTLSLVPVETDFSKPPVAPARLQRGASVSHSGRSASVALAEPGLYMLSSNIQDVHEPWPSGAPEIEVHAFVRNGAGNFVDVQCAGAVQAAPFQFDQNDHTWSGPEVEIVPEGGIGTNPIEVSVWENDATECDPSSGRPPRVSPSNMDKFTAWGPRPTVTVSLVNSVKVVSYATIGVPMALNADTSLNDHDDELGEATVPSCWPSSGATAFNLIMSDAGHPWNGYIGLDYRFGQRDPICPPPAFSVSVSGPGSAPEYSTVTVTATPANYVSPVHYAWTINGTTACADEASCTGTIGAGGTFTNFSVDATDGAGSIASGGTQVFAEFPGCPGCASPPAHPTINARVQWQRRDTSGGAPERRR